MCGRIGDPSGRVPISFPIDSRNSMINTLLQVETLTKLNDELRQRNKSLSEDSEKLARALTSSKGKYIELEAAHEQLKRSTRKRRSWWRRM